MTVEEAVEYYSTRDLIIGDMVDSVPVVRSSGYANRQGFFSVKYDLAFYSTQAIEAEDIYEDIYGEIDWGHAFREGHDKVYLSNGEIEVEEDLRHLSSPA